MRIELRYAPLPGVLGAIAVHYWFVVTDATGARHRLEVWQTRNAGGKSVGHVHWNLMPPSADVGGGPSRIAAEWRGEPADRIVQVLRQIANYPYCQRYRIWPGPNSNTFVAWVLRRAGVRYAFHWKALGARFAWWMR